VRTALVLAITAAGAAQPPVAPATTAERSGFTQTSTHADVLAFLGALQEHPRAARLRVETFGQSAGGKPLVVAFVGEPLPAADALHRSRKLRVLVNANIHGGEVEGKEVAQMLARELLDGAHDDLLAACDLAFVPDFNPDGNDRIDRRNRVDQNGPGGGVGRRENGDGLDLNRDLVKLETSECHALVALLRRFDPHVFFDLHTTDGSHHGYHVTYARSLAVNLDPAIAAVSDALLAQAREALGAQGVRAFEFGDFARVDGRRCWQTFDHLPRYATNYVGLRNRVAVLCEAYSHLGFEQRVKATRAFVLEVARAAVGRTEAIERACTEADLRPAGEKKLAFGFASRFADGGEGEVLVGSCERVAIEGVGTRLVAKPEFTKETMRLRTRFEATQWRELPVAWAIVGPKEATLATLRHHGIVLEPLQEAGTRHVEVFVASKVDTSRRSFQKHLTTTVAGAWHAADLQLPAGAWIVRADQPRARLAAQLLEPESEDSLVTWNHFDGQLGVGPVAGAFDAAALPFPVVRVVQPPMPELPPAPASRPGLALQARVAMVSDGRKTIRQVNGVRVRDDEHLRELLRTEIARVHREIGPDAALVLDCSDLVPFRDVRVVIELATALGATNIQFSVGRTK
jgi:predicted deacylase